MCGDGFSEGAKVLRRKGGGDDLSVLGAKPKASVTFWQAWPSCSHDCATRLPSMHPCAWLPDFPDAFLAICGLGLHFALVSLVSSHSSHSCSMAPIVKSASSLV